MFFLKFNQNSKNLKMLNKLENSDKNSIKTRTRLLYESNLNSNTNFEFDNFQARLDSIQKIQTQTP